MAWVTPKTNWQKTDTFDLDPDYARIRGNLLHLRAMAARLYLPFPFVEMGQYGIADVPGLRFFMAPEENTDALFDNTFRPFGTLRGRAYQENAAVWDANDLNRIEEAHLRLYEDMTAQEAARPVLQFTLGGGIFGSLI